MSDVEPTNLDQLLAHGEPILTPIPPPWRAPTNKILIVQFDGTSVDSLNNSRVSSVQEIPDFIHVDEIPIPVYSGGVGTQGGTLDAIGGRVAGFGMGRQLVRAFGQVLAQYNPGDRIIVIGYSRGAFASLLFAKLIDHLGLPRESLSTLQRNKLLRKLQKRIFTEPFWTTEGKQKMRNACDLKDEGEITWRERVEIEALCLMDPVSALGLPTAGAGASLSKLLRLIPGVQDYRFLVDLVQVIPSVVKRTFMVMSLYETRATFGVHLPGLAPDAKDQELSQIWVPANHSDTAQSDHKQDLNAISLAFQLASLHHSGIKLKQDRVRARYPGRDEARVNRVLADDSTSESGSDDEQADKPADSATTLATMDVEVPDWMKRPIKSTTRINSFLHGKRVRQPGNKSPIKVTHESVSPTVRYRGFGRNVDDTDMVPGYRFFPTQREWRPKVVSRLGSFWQWATPCQKAEMVSSGLRPPLPEQRLLPLEAALLNFPLDG